jgi:hypothetical protein
MGESFFSGIHPDPTLSSGPTVTWASADAHTILSDDDRVGRAVIGRLQDVPSLENLGQTFVVDLEDLRSPPDAALSPDALISVDTYLKAHGHLAAQ